MPLAELRDEIGNVEFDPDLVLASLAPYEEASIDADTLPPPAKFENELPANVTLASSEYKERLCAIAERLQRNTADDSDPGRKAEYSLAASEILAMSGDIAGAQALAIVATTASPGSRLAHMQARHLALESGDIDAAQQLVQDEIHTANDSASLVHLHLWHSEFLRTVGCDRAGALLSLQAASDVAPGDAQVSLLQLLDRLSASESIDLDSAASGSLLGEFDDAVRLLSGLRQETLVAGQELPDRALTLLRVSATLADGDTAGAAMELARLGPLEGCSNALRWLRASLWAATAHTRQAAVDELLRIDELDSELRKALFERSVELPDRDLTHRLLVSDEFPRDESLSPIDELVLGLLASAPAEFIMRCCTRLATTESCAPLTLAAKSILGERAATWHELDATARTQAEWAEWLSATPPNDATTALPIGDSDPLSEEAVALAQVFAIEAARQNQDWGTVADLVLGLPDDVVGAQPGDQLTAAALFYEAAHDRENARRLWQDVLAARPARESALRATLAHVPPAEKSELLESGAQSLDIRDERAVWFLVEAALADPASNYDQAEQLLQHAHVLDPALAVPIILGEDLARRFGHASHVADWATKRGELAEDPVDAALVSVEEALQRWHDDKAAAEACLARGPSEFNDDLMVRELWRQLAPETKSRESRGLPVQIGSDPGAAEQLCQSAAQAAWIGDWPGAYDAAVALVDSSMETVGKIWAEQGACSERPLPRLFEQLFAKARAETDPIVQRELYERLAKLDPNADSEGNFELWQNAIIERTPGYLPALRALELSFVRQQRWQELAVIAERLAHELRGPEALGYAWWATILHIYTGNWAASEPLLRSVASDEHAPLWALRRWYAHIQGQKDWKSMHALECRLAARAAYTSDTTALLIRSAQSAQQLKKHDDALEQLRRAIDISPDSSVAWSIIATLHQENGDLPNAAEALEQFGHICTDRAHRNQALSRAAELWATLKDDARAESALEQVVADDPGDAAAVAKLTACYRKSQAHDRLAALLERQIDNIEAPAERVPLQIERARCLLGLGLTIAADKAVAPVLLAFPENLQALEIKAAVAAALEDWAEAESIYQRLLALADNPTWQADLHHKLGELYEKLTDRSADAEVEYRTLLELRPDDTGGLAALVRLAVRRNDATEALRLQNQLVEKAVEPTEHRDHCIELARIYETTAQDRRRAEEVLERARRKWQNDSIVLKEFAGFYQRVGDSSALQVLLERSTTEARRALHTGRFELALFEVLATVAHLRTEVQAAESADAVVAALTGSSTGLSGVGAAAFDPRHDEGLAPELLNLPLRAMLQQTGWALDSVSPIDLRAYGAIPLAKVDPKLSERAQHLGSSFLIDELQLWVTEKSGWTCVPVQSRPPMVLLGRHFLSNNDASVVDFLLIRALKVVQGHMAGLARTPTVDLGPLVAAYLSSFLPDWQPSGVDMKKVEEFRRQLLQQLPHGYNHAISTLAQDVVVALGNRSSQLGTAANEWGSRCALLATGDPALALKALAAASGTHLPSGEPSERVKWIARHVEARNVVVFGVSDTYQRLRNQLL